MSELSAHDAAASGAVVLTADTNPAPGFAPTDMQVANDTIAGNSPLAQARAAPKGSLAYRNTHYHFELFYPKGYVPTEYDEGNGGRTIIFEKDYYHGFQISVIPYGQRQVSNDRFKIDEPSGVMDNTTTTIVDGVQGTMFFGSNDVMGDTREAWFIHNGYLYEVATYKPLDTLLQQIIQSWKFL